jgi:ATP-dependent RNA helicase DDX3X
MADQLNMGGLSLADSQHANGMTGRSTYIPPHMRGTNGGPPPMDGPPASMMHGDMPNGVWHGPPGYDLQVPSKPLAISRFTGC